MMTDDDAEGGKMDIFGFRHFICERPLIVISGGEEGFQIITVD